MMIGRLIYRSSNRGCKENEILLSEFVNEYIKHASQQELNNLDELLQESDPDIFNWLSNRLAPPQKYSSLIKAILSFNERKNNVAGK